jgi:geranylgeranyl transferase type-2 subunit alpha
VVFVLTSFKLPVPGDLVFLQHCRRIVVLSSSSLSLLPNNDFSFSSPAMHGHRRDEYKARLADPKTAAGLAQKAQQWNTLTEQVLGDKGSFALVEKLLLVNPDPLHLWNARRKRLLLLQHDGTFDIQTEFNLTTSCLERNPKAYGPWFHRKWSCVHYYYHYHYSGHNNTTTNNNNVERQRRVLLENELALCASFLTKDERNFHCWNYRRFIVGLLLGETVDGSWGKHHHDDDDGIMGSQIVVAPNDATTTTTIISTTTLTREERSAIIQSEWDYTTTKIQQNFSNYSAFHYRSKLWELLRAEEGDAKNEDDTLSLSLSSLLQRELDLVHSAMFTEPDDQTAWWYYRFLIVGNSLSKATLEQERATLMELNEAEDWQLKWAWLGLHVVLTELIPLDSSYQQEMDGCLDHLIALDPDRAARYVSMKPQS